MYQMEKYSIKTCWILLKYKCDQSYVLHGNGISTAYAYR